MNFLRANRHSVLLAVLILMSIVQPFAHGLVDSIVAYDLVLSIVLLLVLSVVFERHRDRLMSLALLAPALVSGWAWYAVEGSVRDVAVVVHHSFLIMFFGSAVATILREIFHEKVVRKDHVVGTVCGYLLAGAAWGNAYVLAEIVAPGSFMVKPEIASQLGDTQLRAFVFNYFSLSTLSGAGLGDITPIGPGVATLTWLEAVFGQFYIAVVVAQLVGLRLAQAIGRAA